MCRIKEDRSRLLETRTTILEYPPKAPNDTLKIHTDFQAAAAAAASKSVVLISERQTFGNSCAFNAIYRSKYTASKRFSFAIVSNKKAIMITNQVFFISSTLLFVEIFQMKRESDVLKIEWG